MIESIKQLLKKNRSLLYVAAFTHNIFQCNLHIGKGFYGVFFKRTNFFLKGNNINIKIGIKTRLYNCKIHCEGNDITINIGPDCIFKYLELWVEDDKGSIFIGGKTTIEGGHIAATEGERVEIGENCMFSHRIEIRNGDSHPIFDLQTGDRLNHAQGVNIGNNVWMGTDTKILKGSNVADGCIIATGAILTGNTQPNSIYAGIPAKKVKESISWARQR